MSILVTGGAGYIGSHTCVELLTAGHDVLVADNLSNSSPEALRRVERITGKQPAFAEIDAVKNDRFVVLEYVEATPGPRNIKAVEKLIAGFWGN